MTEANFVVVPMIPAHLNELIVHEYIGYIQEDLQKPEYGEALAAQDSWTAFYKGKIVGCFGLAPMGKYRYHGWALMSDYSKNCMLHITRATNKKFDELNLPRIETNVRSDFANGIRWVKMLNFKCETPEPMKNFGDDGFDYYLYARCD